MTTPRPWLIRLFAALLLLQSGAAMAHCLRGMASAGELIEICSSEGVRLVRVDAEGNEVPGDPGASHGGFCAVCHGLPQVTLPEPPLVAESVRYAARVEWLPAAAAPARPRARA
ncbi:MAG: hypothetical protein K2X11_19860, partial [Acetobacteraceae bacterium]|nr:hypothetical protein [Acetobacteraceae bacterium]